MNKKLAELGIVLASILLMGVFGAIYSLIFAGIAGRAAILTNPSFSFGLAEKYACPPGASIKYVPASGNPQDSVSCVLPGGAQQTGYYDRAVFGVNRIFFLICFIPTFVPGAIMMRLAIRRWADKVSGALSEPPDPHED